jgi:hypothetical protein
MARQTGLNTNTFSRFIIDAGKVYKNYGEDGELALGATRGGSSWKVETEQREMEVDGVIHPIKGSKRIVGVKATLTLNMVEITDDLLLLAFPGASAQDYGDPKTHDDIRITGDVDTDDYCTNITLVGNTTVSSSGYVMIMLDNALADGNLELSFADKDEAVPSITFTAHALSTAPDTCPWGIYWPEEA